ncbi:hypothetical protein OG308_33595 [Nocardia salmonicida]|uniref:Uncharacterized protein n=1 Tax=Nocardia salmonicida TaxID=53431 RepID=A0ABZ1N839_9NOCA
MASLDFASPAVARARSWATCSAPSAAVRYVVGEWAVKQVEFRFNV